MNGHWRAAWLVSTWEFQRFFKIKEQLWSFAIMLGVGLAVFGGGTLVKRITDRETREGKNRVTLALENAAGLPVAAPEEGRIRFEPADATREELAAKVDAGDITGVLTIHGTDRAELLVAKSPTSWQGELAPILNAARSTAELARNNIAPEAVAAVLAPMPLEVAYTGASKKPASRADKVLAVAMVFFTSFAVFGGLATLFVGITGEKTQRVTELVISAISPQAWIDGKIIGHSLVAFAGVLNTLLSFVVFYTVMALLDLPFPDWIDFRGADPLFLLASGVLALAAFLMWFAFFSAVAATIDDPNTSARNAFLFLPMAPLGVAIGLLGHPDSAAALALSFFPPTAAPVLTLRMALSEVPLWQGALGFALVVATGWALRSLAAKIFTVGMMMHGKEPSWREMWRWAREG
ncbi:MAG: ABC transporter permease [Candidatus Sumerlaeia bacterium]|nr:ABC transporter permease [Candidatus Sumerlaeia bacterium]